MSIFPKEAKLQMSHEANPVVEALQYETVHEFCQALGIRHYTVEAYARQLNDLWIRNASDPKGLRSVLEAMPVRGFCRWIMDIVSIGAQVRPPIVTDDGTAFILKNKARQELMKILENAYEDLILAVLELSEYGNVTSRSIRLIQALGTEVKLIWSLLGYSAESCNLGFYLRGGENAVKAALLPLIKASAREKRQAVTPERIVELEETPLILLSSINTKS